MAPKGNVSQWALLLNKYLILQSIVAMSTLLSHTNLTAGTDLTCTDCRVWCAPDALPCSGLCQAFLRCTLFVCLGFLARDLVKRGWYLLNHPDIMSRHNQTVCPNSGTTGNIRVTTTLQWRCKHCTLAPLSSLYLFVLKHGAVYCQPLLIGELLSLDLATLSCLLPVHLPQNARNLSCSEHLSVSAQGLRSIWTWARRNLEVVLKLLISTVIEKGFTNSRWLIPAVSGIYFWACWSALWKSLTSTVHRASI